MYPSTEMRWYSRTECKPLADWFAKRDLSFQSTAPRTDFYLPLPGKTDLNIKLREGNIEIKQRTGDPQIRCLTPLVEGYFESWIKWSFRADQLDELSRAIIHEKKYGWIEVYKERMGIVLSLNGDILDMKIPVAAGCQIEYTRIFFRGEEWFTFGLEWFGEERGEIPAGLLAEMLGDTRLQLQDSMGYAGFLAR